MRMRPAVKIRIDDLTPSARGITASVRVLLWGIVQVIVQNEAAQPEIQRESVHTTFDTGSNDSNSLPSVFAGSGDSAKPERICAVQYHVDAVTKLTETKRSQRDREYEEQFLSEVKASRSDLEDNMKEFAILNGDLEDQLPLSFGRKAVSKPHRTHLDNAYESLSPDENYSEMMELPKPPPLFMESNIHWLKIYRSGNDESLPSLYQLVRVIGCGRSKCVADKKCETTVVEFLDMEGEVRKGKKLEVDRDHLRVCQSISRDVRKSITDILCSDIIGPPDVHTKYWDQRFRLFRLFDRGVRMDAESYYSVTPECISQHIADRLLQSFRVPEKKELSSRSQKKERQRERKRERERAMAAAAGDETAAAGSADLAITAGPVPAVPTASVTQASKISLVLDLFCGCGGNAIPLASVCDSVIAVDINPQKLADARVNARVYSMEQKIDFVCADAYDILSALTPPDSSSGVSVVDAIILAPPWGGPDYNTHERFDMTTGFPSGDGYGLIRLAAQVCGKIVCVFPRNIDRRQVQSFAHRLEMDYLIEDICLYRKHKMSIIYFTRLQSDS